MNEIFKEDAIVDEPEMDEVNEEEVLEEDAIEEIPSTELIRYEGKKEKKKRAKYSESDFSAFVDLANLMNTTVTQIKDECCSFQIQKLMNRVGKAIVRYSVTEKQLEKILLNSSALAVKEVVITPTMLSLCSKVVEKHSLQSQSISLLIDFPFGESSLQTKLQAVKEGKRAGVDSITVTLPISLLEPERRKELKKQVKKIKRSFRGEIGLAISPDEVKDEDLKFLVKFAEKKKIRHITLTFGAVSFELLTQKTQLANKHKGKMQLKIMGNVEDAYALMHAIKLNADLVLTPFADEIGKELVKRFDVKTLKLK